MSGRLCAYLYIQTKKLQEGLKCKKHIHRGTLPPPAPVVPRPNNVPTWVSPSQESDRWSAVSQIRPQIINIYLPLLLPSPARLPPTSPNFKFPRPSRPLLGHPMAIAAESQQQEKVIDEVLDISSWICSWRSSFVDVGLGFASHSFLFLPTWSRPFR